MFLVLYIFESYFIQKNKKIKQIYIYNEYLLQQPFDIIWQILDKEIKQ